MVRKPKSDAAGVAVLLVALYIGNEVAQRIFERPHKTVLRDTYRTVQGNTPDEAKILVDHIDPRGADGSTRQLDLDHYPDIVARGGAGVRDVAIEVEDDGTLDRHAASQLNEMKKLHCRRILVVPSGTVEEAREFVSDLDGNVRVATSSSVAKFL